MYLSHVSISNFRGIRELKVDFNDENTVLIGENAWGKSSLLRALWLVLGQGDKLCKLKKEDMYIPIEIKNIKIFTHELPVNNQNLDNEKDLLDAILKENDFKKDNKFFLGDEEGFKDDIYRDDIDKIEISLIFKETYYGQILKSNRLQSLNPLWTLDDDGLYFIHYQILGYRDGDNFVTEHNVLDHNGSCISCANKDDLLILLIHMNPVLRVRDSRTSYVDNLDDKKDIDKGDISFDDYLVSVSKEFAEFSKSDDFTASQAITGLETLNFITNNYLIPYNQKRQQRKDRKNTKSIRDMVNAPVSIESLSNLKETLESKFINKEKILAFYLATAVFLSKGKRTIDKKSHPILILEDIEGRFHPSILLSFWSVVSTIPIQKIITTNSGDFLSAISLSNIRRLCKQHYDTKCYSVKEKSFSADDLRRIAFHIRLNRSTTLFARFWILVEGETEIWILNQMATVLGISLQCIGIRTVEFAQCGLHPLIKLARQLGINFHVITDGDEAGHKYAQTVAQSVGSNHLKKHLTILPHKDIEHFLYVNGFADVFMRCAGLDKKASKSLSIDRIIEIAIRKKTKPGLALEVLESMVQKGEASVPSLFVRMFSQILSLVKSDNILS